MNIVAANIGSYPRIGDKPEQQQLRNALAALDRGEITNRDLSRVISDVGREILAEQARAGLDVVSDGQIRMADPVSHVMRKFRGVSITGLLRYFDTNTYFRQPQVTGTLAENGSLVADEFKLARAISTRPVIANILGPLSLSRLSVTKGGPYPDANQLMDALVPLMAAEVERLVTAGADAIVVEEPFLLREPEALPRVADALEVLAARKGALRLWLWLTFGDASGLYEKLQNLPVDGLILDFTYSKDIAEVVAVSGSRLGLGLGLVDARNTRLESPARVATLAGKLLKRVRADVVGLFPSNGLEYLPRPRAFEKLTVLARARDLLTGTRKSGKPSRRRVTKVTSRRRGKSRKPRRSVSRRARTTRSRRGGPRRGRG